MDDRVFEVSHSRMLRLNFESGRKHHHHPPTSDAHTVFLHSTTGNDVLSVLPPPDLGRDPLVTGKQVMEIRHTLKDPRSLADPISAAGHTGELLLRDLCWKQANGGSVGLRPRGSFLTRPDPGWAWRRSCGSCSPELASSSR